MTKSYDVTIQMKPLRQYFHMVLFVFQYFIKLNLGFLVNFYIWHSWEIRVKYNFNKFGHAKTPGDFSACQYHVVSDVLAPGVTDSSVGKNEENVSMIKKIYKKLRVTHTDQINS